jgi:hypothetical protein
MVDVLKLAGVLALVVFLLNRKWRLSLVLLLASALLGLLFCRPPLALARDAWVAVTDPLTLRLVAIVILILVLGELLRRTARLDGMVHALEQLVPDGRVVFAAVPAFIGLLPMVGGALFSAPMVNHIGDRLEASSDRKTFVNYWFRHVWEYVFPLYPSFLVGATLLGLSDSEAALLLWPLTVASIAGGVLFGLLGLRKAGGERPSVHVRASLWELVSSVWPIALVLLLSLGLKLDLLLSLLVTILLLVVIHRVGPRQMWDIPRHHVRWDTAAVILAAMIFREVLETTGAIAVTAEVLTAWHVAPVVAVFAAPFLAGLLSGLGTAAFAIGIPIILPLIGPQEIAPEMAMWAWAGAFIGIMMSPVHLCLALTREYFGADWGGVYRMIVPASLLILGVAGGILLF